ncbi:glycosyltransferase EpsH [Cerasibacillus quisquiliarum]|uniref:Glycosyltransferase 2-like domain-containing protein n=1 Tax=Cerasibacillus quisquiliarum TaxID=227865 RepID=A0A511UWL4_9BACI|nr:glycosyltransferase [Cerasibacillus quisquiliarum]MBB5144967.1 glycosyltransferase EpsH [Cerasibacillus quisquiliarum]GEN30138.1 hypothetical protein CQU01_03760 [Cerasibacillus quisquiliarum]
MDKISIIVPVYNSERYLAECLDSLINQTYKNIEIILINDGSTDGSKYILDEYERKDSRIKVKHLENGGVSRARNVGLEMVTGEWITFVDSDDWVEPDMLSFSMKKAIDTKSDIIIWSYFKNYFNKQIPLSLVPGGDQIFIDEKDLLCLKSIYQMMGESRVKESVSAGTVWCKLYKRNIIEDNNLRFKVGLTRAQDSVFSIHAFMIAEKIAYFDKNLYHYRINNSSTCSGTRFIPDSEKPFNQLLSEFDSFIKKYNLGSEYYTALNGRTIQVLMWHLKHNFFHKQNSKSILTRRAKIINLLNKEPYKTAISNVDTDLLPKKEKLMVMLFKYKLILTFYFINNLHSKVEKRSNRRYK